jgi:hypothetical protein
MSEHMVLLDLLVVVEVIKACLKGWSFSWGKHGKRGNKKKPRDAL